MVFGQAVEGDDALVLLFDAAADGYGIILHIDGFGIEKLRLSEDLALPCQDIMSVDLDDIGFGRAEGIAKEVGEVAEGGVTGGALDGLAHIAKVLCTEGREFQLTCHNACKACIGDLGDEGGDIRLSGVGEGGYPRLAAVGELVIQPLGGAVLEEIAYASVSHGGEVIREGGDTGIGQKVMLLDGGNDITKSEGFSSDGLGVIGELVLGGEVDLTAMTDKLNAEAQVVFTGSKEQFVIKLLDIGVQITSVGEGEVVYALPDHRWLSSYSCGRGAVGGCGRLRCGSLGAIRLLRCIE